MKILLMVSVVFSALLIVAPAQAIEISADTVRVIQVYSGNARIIFMPKEDFDITSDNTSKQGGVIVFSGRAVVRFPDGMAEADSIAVTKLPDGTSVLESSGFSLEYFQKNTN